MKARNFKRALCALLVMTVGIIPLTACGDKNKENDNNNDPSAGYVFVPSFVEVPDEVREMNSVASHGDKLFFTANVPIKPDGTVVSAEEMDEYQAQWDAYYSQMSGGGVTIDSVARPAVANTEAPDAEGEEPDAEDPEAGDTDEPTQDTDTPTPPADIPEPPDMEYTYETRLYSINRDGTGYAELPDFKPIEKPEGDYGYTNMYRLLVGGDGTIWAVESTSQTIFDLPEGFDGTEEERWEHYVRDEQKFYVRAISETGAELSRLCVNDFVQNEQDYFYLSSFAVDQNGNFVFDDGNGTIYCVSPEGAKLFELKLDGWVNGITTLKDGNLVAICYPDNGVSEMRIIDTAAKTWGKTMPAPYNAWEFFPSAGEYDFCYSNNSALMGFKVETGEALPVITWINNDIDGSNVRYSEIQENGDIFVVSQVYEDDGVKLEMATLVKTPISETTVKKTITLATTNLDYEIREEILKFNRSNSEYRIEVKDYSIYETAEDYNAGVTKLNTEIVSGNVPDIIAINSLPYKQYAAKGLLEDLYPYIDSDSELSREDFISSVMGAIESDGKLFYMGSSFYLQSMIGNSDYVGTEPGWTMEELRSIIEQNPQADCPLGMGMSRESVFYSLFMMSMDSYVDWQTGECRFDTEEFKSFLEFAKTFPKEKDIDYESMEWVSQDVLVREGRQLASSFSLSDFQSYQYAKAMYGDKMVFKGLPVAEGVGTIANVRNGLAITTSCKEKEAAWSFLRGFLTEEYQKDIWDMPTNKNAFEAKLKEAMTQEYYIDENGERKPVSMGGMSMGDGESIDFYALTEEEGQAVRDLIDSIQYTSDYDEALVNIVQDEAAAFFNDEKSVDEVASIIQSRMNIYINEQR